MEYLKTKALNNYQIAKEAITLNCYDAAISRYYYYLYELVILCLIKEGRYQDGDQTSHSFQLKNFYDLCYNKYKIKRGEMMKLKKINNLKSQRIESDYSNSEIISNETEFQNHFKKKFDIVFSKLSFYNLV